MSVVAVIPARIGSSRLPRKPLLRDTGRTLIEHVYERVAAAASIDRVIVATDNDEIAQAVASFGGEARMTSADHRSGTDRVAEVAADLPPEVSHVVNVQGDEPEIEPAAIDALVDVLRRDADAKMATLACPMGDVNQLSDPNCVKVVLDNFGRAIYFSRSVVPYPRDTRGQVDNPGDWLLHLGIYGYTRAFLLEFASWQPTRLEQIEQLEQLRAIEHGVKLAVGLVDRAAPGIDTPADYAAFVQRTTGR